MAASETIKMDLKELNPHFLCVLCFGYFVNATTITECMHTFCRSCIVNFLDTNRHCPSCDTLLSKTRPHSSLRSDRIMQALVYKVVPGFFQAEMRRRIDFYRENPHPADYEKDVRSLARHVFSPEDSVSLAISYHDLKHKGSPPAEESGSPAASEQQETGVGEGCPARYFRCPATVPVSVLKLLVRSKYMVPDAFKVELLCDDQRLADSWTLMQVAYIHDWKREEPLQLKFQVLMTRKVKRRRSLKEEGNYEEAAFPSAEKMEEDLTEPPQKVSRVESSTTTTPLSPEANLGHPRPLTPPETPDHPPEELLTRYRPTAEDRMAAEVLGKMSQRQQLKDDMSHLSSEEDTLVTVGDDAAEDQDSEVALEVDTSHETEVDDRSEKDMKISEEDDSCKVPPDESKNATLEVAESKSDEAAATGGVSKGDTYCPVTADDAGRPAAPEERDEMGALDLSHHARSVRAKRLSNESFSPSSSPHGDPAQSPSRLSSREAKGQSTQTILSIAENGNEGPQPETAIMPIPSFPQRTAALLPDWTTPMSHQVATLDGLLKLSQVAAAHKLVTMAEEAHKRQAEMLKNLKATESLSFVNGSGDTLTISPITTMDQRSLRTTPPLKGTPSLSKFHPPKSLCNAHDPKHILTQGKHFSHSKSVKHNKNVSHSKLSKTNLIVNNPRNHKPPTQTNGTFSSSKTNNKLHGSLKTTISKSAISSSLKMPPSSCKPQKVEKNEKDKKERTGDPVFKITNQKLAEFVRQQHLTNKLKQNNITTKVSNSVAMPCKASSSPVTCDSTPKVTTAVSTASSKPNTNTASATHTSGLTVSKPNSSCVSRPQLPVIPLTPCTTKPSPSVSSSFLSLSKNPSGVTNTTTSPKVSNLKTTSSSSSSTSSFSSATTAAAMASTTTTTNASSSSSSSGLGSSFRSATVRQIPNPSLLHQQSESRISASLGALMAKKSSSGAPMSRIESLTRSLHEKVAAAATAVNSAAR